MAQSDYLTPINFKWPPIVVVGLDECVKRSKLMLEDYYEIRHFRGTSDSIFGDLLRDEVDAKMKTIADTLGGNYVDDILTDQRGMPLLTVCLAGARKQVRIHHPVWFDLPLDSLPVKVGGATLTDVKLVQVGELTYIVLPLSQRCHCGLIGDDASLVYITDDFRGDADPQYWDVTA